MFPSTHPLSICHHSFLSSSDNQKVPRLFSFFFAHKMGSVECVKHRHTKFGGSFFLPCNVIDYLKFFLHQCHNNRYILCNVPNIQIVPFDFSTFLHNLILFLLNLCFSSILVSPSENLSHEPLFTETIFPV